MKPGFGGGISSRITRAFLLQGIIISLVAGIGVYVAGFVIEELLIKQALRQEADYFWANFSRDPSYNVPHTRNLAGYFAPLDNLDILPAHLSDLEPGFHSLPVRGGFSEAFTSDYAGARLVLVFNVENLNHLSLWFGLVPLALALTVIYFLAWLTWRQSRSAFSPVIKLAKQVSDLDLERPDAEVFGMTEHGDVNDHEVKALADALYGFAQRINAFVDRERAFTRDASHELRSPLTVIRMATDIMLTEGDLNPATRNTVLRIRRSAVDMEELVEVFLLLAREQQPDEPVTHIELKPVAEKVVEECRGLLKEKPVSIELWFNNDIELGAPEKVVSVLLGNLIRNACVSTQKGTIEVKVDGHSVTIEDSGIGISEESMKHLFEPFFTMGAEDGKAHGIGLSIVRRLCERYGWQLKLESEPGVGTRVTVLFSGNPMPI